MKKMKKFLVSALVLMVTMGAVVPVIAEDLSWLGRVQRVMIDSLINDAIDGMVHLIMNH